MSASSNLPFSLVNSTIESMPICLSYWSLDNTCLYANKKHRQVFSVQENEVHSHNIQDFFVSTQENTSPPIQKFFSDIVQSNDKNSIHTRCSFRLNENHNILADINLEYHKIEEQECIALYIQNICAVENLNSSECPCDEIGFNFEQMQAILDSIPTVIHFWDENLNLIAVSSAAPKMFHFESKEEYIQNFSNLHPEFQENGKPSAEYALELVKETFQKGFLNFEWIHKDRDGNLFHVEVTLKLSIIEGKKIVIAYIQSLQDRYRAQSLQDEAYGITKAIRDTLPFGVTFFDTNFNIIDCNEVVLNLFQVDKETYCERFFDLSPKYQPNGMTSIDFGIQLLTQTLKEGSYQGEWLHQRLDGTLIFVEITLMRFKFQGKDIITGYARDLTETKNIIQQITSATEREQIIFNSIPMAIEYWDKNMQLKDCNDELLNKLGTYKQYYLDNIMEFTPKYQADGRLSDVYLTDYVERTFKEGVVHFYWDSYDKQGKIITFEVTSIRLVQNNEFFVATFSIDQTEYFENLKKLREAEERNNTVINASPFAIVLLDKKGQVFDCNQAVLDTYGFKSKDDFFRNYSKTFLGQHNYEHLKQSLGITIQEGTCAYEATLQHVQTKDQIPVEVQLRKVMIAGEDCILSFIYDMREQKANLKKIQDADERTRIMFNTFPMGANFWDKDYNLLDCNDACYKLYGFPSKEDYIQGFNLVSPVFQPDGSPSGEKILELLKQGYEEGYAKFEWMCRHIEGYPIPVEVTLNKVFYNDEYVVISYVRDLRELKDMLEEIHAVEQDLRAARDLAEKNAKAKSEFLANMSHEIRTPMNGILGLLSLLSLTDMNDLQKEYVEKTLYSANSLLRIINDILDFSKIEAGKMAIENIPFTIQDVCNDLWSLYNPKVQEKHLTYNINSGNEPEKTITGDPLRLKQVLYNLVSNAIKFTEHGGITVNIECTSQKKNQHTYLFSVHDTGIGLTEEHMGKLFEAFSQADTSVTRKYGGTGLGLIISKRIVEMMNGRIWVESESGKGSTFFFTATFEVSDIKISKEKEKVMLDASSFTSPPKVDTKWRVLLVEDNKINQLVAQEILKKANYFVTTVDNGQEALDILEEQEFDVILMDIQMPIMDGLTATKKIRENKKFEKLPIFAMSAHAMLEDKQKSLDHGMNEHITKPISPQVLFQTLNNWLK